MGNKGIFPKSCSESSISSKEHLPIEGLYKIWVEPPNNNSSARATVQAPCEFSGVYQAKWLSFPHPWADPKSRSMLGFYNLHHRSIRVQNWGIYFLDPPRGLGLCCCPTKFTQYPITWKFPLNCGSFLGVLMIRSLLFRCPYYGP